MLRNLGLAILVVVSSTSLGGVSAASAKEWARKMFATTAHDFGHVARGSKTEFAFEIQNQFEEDVHIADVRTSCGCVAPTITKSTLKTWEQGTIVASLNTKAFLGQRTSTLTVVIDKPYYAEVSLNIAGYIHGDVDFQPGSIAFGDVEQGAKSEQEIAVTYYGRNAWQITDVRSVNPHLEVELSEPRRAAGGIAYKMLVRLQDDAPAGALIETLNLVTNDPRLPRVSVAVEGRVVPPLAVSPASLFLGVLKPGQVVTKQIVITGKQPFKVLSVQCDNPAFAFKTSDVSKKVHLVPVTFTAGAGAAEIEQTIQIETDLASGGTTSVTARGSVQAAGETASAGAESRR
ncbi:MAG: DUF1573 domain-containing protein [Pirellulaceae bacterium]